ncbi:Pre-mRNA-processing factor 31 [Aphelenchoides bicaudatus]|nr:Pre-mRNA-processing factor 31 [Aphelenchoides bicaudatus]
MSLADQLLADLDDEDTEDLEQLIKKEENDEIDEAMEATPAAGIYDRVTDVAKLSGTIEYQQLISRLHEMLDLPEIPPFSQPLETDAQYELVVKLSELAVDIDQEIGVIHKFVRDKYQKRFPELETFVQMPLDFLRTVQVLGNNIDVTSHNNKLLDSVVPPASRVVISVTASTTQGKLLDEDELKIVMDGCEMAEKLYEERMHIHQFVEQRMTLIAPNLCRILGSGTAAMIVSQAGGLGPLSKMPSCNILVLGKQKKTLSGFSTAAVMPHAGFIYYHPIVQTLPPDLRQKVARIVAGKCTLAARADSLHSALDGSIGDAFSSQIKQKIDKMLEPPPVKDKRALPKPLDKATKKRGGKRARKLKERYGMTELRKRQNRMNFGELQEEVDQQNMGVTLGQNRSETVAGGGRIRANVIDGKTKIRMSQKMQKSMQRQQHGGLTAIKSKISGTASSVSFTPINGLEIISMTPIDTKSSGQSTSSSYFSSTSNFKKVQTPAPK